MLTHPALDLSIHLSSYPDLALYAVSDGDSNSNGEGVVFDVGGGGSGGMEYGR